MNDFIKLEKFLETLTSTIILVTTTLSQFGLRLYKWVVNNNNILDRIAKSEKSELVEKKDFRGKLGHIKRRSNFTRSK